jgi:putative ABC transport system permease protein
MFGYYLELAVRSLKRNIGLTILMIVAIAFGIGASMTTLTVLHLLSADPIPGKSDDLYYVQLDPLPKRPGDRGGNYLPYQLTRTDAENLVRAKQGDRQALMASGNAAVEPARAGIDPFFADARFSTADFFPMFRVPFVAGTGWTEADDEAAARVVVVSRALAEKALGSTDIVGKVLRVGGVELRVAGVIDNWRPTPRFYDLNTERYGPGEQLFVPFSTALDIELNRSGTMNCWSEAKEPEALGAPCEWIQFWVELDSAEKARAYEQFLIAYSEEQKRVGRFERDPNVRLHTVMEWLAFNEVVPGDVRLQVWIALGFLLVCLINTVGLLLTKFLRRSSEIGVRRALGASKRSIFIQLLVESGMIGLVGGLAGLGLAYLGLWAVRQQPADYANLARLDVSMLATTFALAVVASLMAGLLPAWRGCQITPAIQLKSH